MIFTNSSIAPIPITQYKKSLMISPFNSKPKMALLKSDKGKVARLRNIPIAATAMMFCHFSTSNFTSNDVLVVEMNLGQMYYEVDRAVNATVNTHLLGVIGGLLPTPEEILSKIEEIGGN